MKLAMLTSKLDRDAKEEGFIVDWVDALAEQADELVVFILTPQKTKLKSKNVRIYSLGNKKTSLEKLYFLFNVFYKENKKKKFDGIFSHMYDFLGISAGLLGKLFKVKTIMWFAWGLNLKRFSMAELSLRLNDEIITCSHQAKKRYTKAYKLKKRIHVFGHAVDTKRFKNKGNKKLNDFSIGSIGRTIREKNFELLIQAVSNVNTHEKITVVLILAAAENNQPYFSKIKRLISEKQKPNLKFKLLTKVPHEKIPGLLRKMHLYIHPALVYTVDKSAIEAISSHTPVLLSEFGYKEICKKNPDIIFNPNDAQELARKIKYALSNYQVFSKKQHTLQKNIRASFSTETFMKKLVSLYTF